MTEASPQAERAGQDAAGAVARNHPLLSNGSLILLCVAIAASTGLLHWHLLDVPWYRRQIEWHERIVRGLGPYPDQYRILTYMLAEGLIRAGAPFTASYVALRFVFTSASLFVFHRYLGTWVRPPFALLGLFMVAAVLPLTFTFYFMQPTDPLNMLVFFAAFLALREERDGWLIPLTLVGTLNRETAMLLPALYALVRFKRAPLSRWLPNFAVSTAVAVGVELALHAFYGTRPPYTNTSLRWYWLHNLSDPAGWIQTLGFFGLFLWVGVKELKHAPPFLKRAALLLTILFAVHFSVGRLKEPRLFLPVLPIVVPLTLIALQRRSEESVAPAH